MRDRIPAAIGVALLSTAVAASALAQHTLRVAKPQQTDGLWFVLIALVLSIAAGRVLPTGAPIALASVASLRPIRPRCVWIGAASLVLVVALQASGRAPLLQIGALVASIISWFAAYAPSGGWTKEPVTVRATQAALLVLSSAACLYALDRIPGGLHGDEGSFGLEVLALLDGRPTPPFAVGWSDSPTLFAWMQAAGVRVAGRDIGGLRFAAAIGGVLCVLPWFGLLRRDLGVVAAAGGAALVAVTPLHVHVSRLAQSESWICLFAFAAMGALYAALRTGSAAAFVHAGTWTGLCFYMANKAVLLPPILVGGALFLGVALGPTAVVRQWRGLLLVALFAALALLPQLVHYARHDWFAPIVGHPSRWMGKEHPDGRLGHLLQVARLLVDGAEASSFSPFTRTGRMVTAWEGAMFVVGLGLCLARPRRPLAAFLLGWLCAGLGSLLLDVKPNQLMHALLVTCLPAGFGAVALHALCDGITRAGRRPVVGAVVVAALAAALVVANAREYFGRGDGAAPWTNARFTQLGKSMHEHRDTHHVALVTPKMSWDISTTLMFLAPGYKAPTKLTELDPTKPWLPDGVDQDVAFLVDGTTTRLLSLITARFPGATIEERRGAAGELLLVIVRVPRDEVRRVEGALRSTAP